jgi:prepilin-type N-terminal cleavage/methylation domain-containing protein
MRSKRVNQNGFTLIELIVVMAGLGILSGLVIPNVLKYLDYARVDEAKALLNSAAADCLQGLRREGTQRLTESVDENILSNERLESTGYKFTDIESTSSCGNTLITAISPNEQVRLPDLGFSILPEGKLTKISANTGVDTAFACKGWAGANCTDGAGLKELMAYKQSISEARAKCIEDFDTWLENVGDNGTTTWDETAESGCPSTPPLVVSGTCTTEGCTKPIYALDNQVVGNTQAAYDEAFKAKYDELCSEEVISKRDANAMTPNGQVEGGELLNNCGEKRFWFFEGESVGTREAWKSLKCDSNKQDLINSTHNGPVEFCDTSPIYICGGEELTGDNAEADYETCLTTNKDARCTQALNADALMRGDGGAFTSPTPEDMSAPIGRNCNIQYWYCTKSGKIHETKDDYEADESCQNKDCKKPERKCNQDKNKNRPECIEYLECLGS